MLSRLVLPAAAAAALLVAGCDNIVNQRGHVANPGAYEKLEIGTQGREDVVRLLGSPSTVATFNDETWYYISQRQESFAFLEPKITEQKVVAVSFGPNGRVKDIKTYGPGDGREVAMVDRVTPTGGKELTALEQIFGNIGRFTQPKGQQAPGSGPGR